MNSSILKGLWGNTLLNGIVFTGACIGGIKILNRMETYLSSTRFRWLICCTPVAKLYVLYTTHSLLSRLELPLTSFPLWLLDTYTTLSGLWFVSCTLTAIVGYPILTSLYYYLDYLFSRFIRSVTNNTTDNITVNGQPISVNRFVQILQNLMRALEANQNWSANYGSFVIKTHPNSNKLTEDQVNEICPLSCTGKHNAVIAQEEICTVCTDDVTPQQLHRKLPCGHIFHAACIDEWIMLHKTCPSCRESIN